MKEKRAKNPEQRDLFYGSKELRRILFRSSLKIWKELCPYESWIKDKVENLWTFYLPNKISQMVIQSWTPTNKVDLLCSFADLISLFVFGEKWVYRQQFCLDLLTFVFIIRGPLVQEGSHSYWCLHYHFVLTLHCHCSRSSLEKIWNYICECTGKEHRDLLN